MTSLPWEVPSNSSPTIWASTTVAWIHCCYGVSQRMPSLALTPPCIIRKEYCFILLRIMMCPNFLQRWQPLTFKSWIVNNSMYLNLLNSLFFLTLQWSMFGFWAYFVQWIHGLDVCFSLITMMRCSQLPTHFLPKSWDQPSLKEPGCLWDNNIFKDHNQSTKHILCYFAGHFF